MREGKRERDREGKRENENERNKREGKRERDGQTKNKQRNTCREWNKPKRCPEKKKGNQPDKTQSQEIPKPRIFDLFPTARAAFIGIYISFLHLVLYTRCLT